MKISTIFTIFEPLLQLEIFKVWNVTCQPWKISQIWEVMQGNKMQKFSHFSTSLSQLKHAHVKNYLNLCLVGQLFYCEVFTKIEIDFSECCQNKWIPKPHIWLGSEGKSVLVVPISTFQIVTQKLVSINIIWRPLSLKQLVCIAESICHFLIDIFLVIWMLLHTGG